MEAKTNATFIAYSGRDLRIKGLVGQEGFNVEILADNRLQIRKGSLTITTSPIIATTSGRAFEYKVYTYRTQSGTEYQFSTVAVQAHPTSVLGCFNL